MTGWVQTAYYAVWIRAGDPKPQPGSRQFANDRRKIQILVVLAYLIYTIYEADYQILQTGDFYRDLGVDHGVDERGLQSRFRRLTVLHHPDKVTDPSKRQLAEAYYVHLKLARDTLVDPAKRFAYDRFGPGILQWRHCTTIRDFVLTGVRDIAMYYAGTLVVLILFGILGYLQQAPYWRYWALATLFMFELFALTRSEAPAVLTKVLNPAVTLFKTHPPYLQFQVLNLARKLMLSFFIALSQIGPLIFPPPPGKNGDEVSEQQLARLDMIANSSDQEISRLMGLEVIPFTTDTRSMQELRSSMRTWLVDNTVRSNPEVRDAMGRVIARRRTDAPPGARGS